MSCEFKPEELVNVPMGMFHCPECGEMVLAGYPHPPTWLELQKDKKFLDALDNLDSLKEEI